MTTNSPQPENPTAAPDGVWTVRRAARNGLGWGILFGLFAPLLLLLAAGDINSGTPDAATAGRPRRLTRVQYTVTVIVAAIVGAGELALAARLGLY